MKLEEYPKQQQRYQQFAKTVATILSEIIQQAYPYENQPCVQHIPCRAKSYESLQKKLSARKQLDDEHIEDNIKDLAGCRIIFYYNADATAFVSSGLIYSNFKVIEDKSHGVKYDHQKPQEGVYTAKHYCVELSDQCTALAEYKNFKGLQCEIQVQTLLGHAYAKTAHNMTYKQPEDLQHVQRHADWLATRLGDIQEKYLLPAERELDLLKYDYNCLLSGKKSIPTQDDLKTEIKNHKNNNERQAYLQSFYSRLTVFDDNYLKIRLPDIIWMVDRVIALARSDKETPIPTLYGEISGKSVNDIVTVGCQIIDYFRYVDTTQTFPTVLKVYRGAKNDDERSIVDRFARDFVAIVPRQSDFQRQMVILDCLEKLKVNDLACMLDLITVIGAQLLRLRQFTSEAMHITKGYVPGNDDIRNMRQRAIALLQRTYRAVSSTDAKHKIIDSFHTDIIAPNGSEHLQQLCELGIQSGQAIIDFYKTLIAYETHRTLQKIEKQVCWLYRKADGVLSQLISSDKKEQRDACQKLMASALSFRDTLNQNKQFLAYKTLIGIDSVFLQSWQDRIWALKEKNPYRTQAVEQYAAQVTKENWESFWKRCVIDCANTNSSDGGDFLYFNRFMTLLAHRQPKLLLDLIDEQGVLLLKALPFILKELLESAQRERVIEKMKVWCEAGDYLGPCAFALKNTSPLNEDLLAIIFEKARHSKDTEALHQIISVVTQYYTEDAAHLIGRVYLPAIQALSEMNDNWCSTVWCSVQRYGEIISTFTEEETDTFLSYCVPLADIDFYMEDILMPIAEKYPAKIIALFKSRIAFSHTQEHSVSEKYQAVPYNFDKFNNPLSKNLAWLMTEIFSWYDGNNKALFRFQGARLLHNIFPNFPNIFAQELITRVNNAKATQKNNWEVVKIVLDVLENYQGNPAIREVCKAIVAVLPEKHRLLSCVKARMENTGVQSGEYAMPCYSTELKNCIESWINDKNKKVASFAKEYTDSLNNRIIDETKRVDERVALGKHLYGDKNEDAT